ncbi:hypothetical protein PUN28_011336 [Cardiocondyla obscurior]|uniref:Secreted protein n=1 Tax=Cardiocondyla obscurior TaxID=286306 RepID=A0AAW2FFB2_9HYME
MQCVPAVRINRHCALFLHNTRLCVCRDDEQKHFRMQSCLSRLLTECVKSLKTIPKICTERRVRRYEWFSAHFILLKFLRNHLLETG